MLQAGNGGHRTQVPPRRSTCRAAARPPFPTPEQYATKKRPQVPRAEPQECPRARCAPPKRRSQTSAAAAAAMNTATLNTRAPLRDDFWGARRRLPPAFPLRCRSTGPAQLPIQCGALCDPLRFSSSVDPSSHLAQQVALLFIVFQRSRCEGTAQPPATANAIRIASSGFWETSKVGEPCRAQTLKGRPAKDRTDGNPEALLCADLLQGNDTSKMKRARPNRLARAPPKT